MGRAILYFSFSALLSVLNFFDESEHSLELYLVIPAGLFFIFAYLLSFRPEVSWTRQLQFSALSLLIWVLLFGVSYNPLFLILAPLSGGIGAWLICLLGKKFLGIAPARVGPVILAGVAAGVLGVMFMISVKSLPREIFTMGLKVGVVVAFWQLGVGIMLARNHK